MILLQATAVAIALISDCPALCTDDCFALRTGDHFNKQYISTSDSSGLRLAEQYLQLRSLFACVMPEQAMALPVAWLSDGPGFFLSGFAVQKHLSFLMVNLWTRADVKD